MHGWVDGWMDELLSGWMDGLVSGWIDEQMAGWLEGWMNGYLKGISVPSFIGGNLMAPNYSFQHP